jgi:hypothetical protein
VTLAIAVCAIYSAYAVRYGYMLLALERLSASRSTLTQHELDVVPEYHVREDGLLNICIGPRQWELPDWNERISVVVRNLERSYGVQSMAIWGWAPGVYVLTGMPPATRYSVTPIETKAGPLSLFYRDRLMADLRSHPPDLFIDAVGRGMLVFNFTEQDGYELLPDLRKFIDDNYVLVDQQPVIKGSKPVRFFVRRELVTVADKGKN